MQTGRTAPTGEALSGSDPLLTLVHAFEAEVVLFNADDNRPDAIWDALWLQLAHRTPECTTDEGAFAALTFVARELQENLPNELTESILQSVLDYAHRRQCDD